MIAHHEKRWLYIGIPRTGSTALHVHLQELGGEAIGEQHEVCVPEELRSYSLFATVMNPFRRAVSLYYLFGRDAEKESAWVREFPAAAARSFDAFLGDVLECSELINPVYQFTISQWMERGRLGAEVTLIPVERVAAGLAELGVVATGADIPIRNQSRLGSWEQQYDSRLEARVAEWAEADLGLLDYPNRIEGIDAADREPRRYRLFSWRRRA